MIYDSAQARHLVIDGSVGERQIRIHDYARDCEMTGERVRATYRLYDHGAAQHLFLVIDGEKFEGYDHGSICHFSGKMNGSDISLYDHGVGRSFSYRL